jgi:L-iditol 2-dehydrogenase
MKTRIARVKAPWQFEVRTVELPDRIPDGWLRVKIAACGVCGSDLGAAAERAKDWEVFGHEIAAVVDDVGAGVEGVKKGQQVVLESSSFCGKCEVCRDGRVDLCQRKAPNFWEQQAMGFSDYMLAPTCCAVPYDGLSAEVASLAECAGVGYDLVRTAGIQMGERVAIIGPGPIGLVATALAKHQAPCRLTMIGHSAGKKRLELARELGAETFAFDCSLADRQELRRQFDHVLMTAPPAQIEPALALLAFGGEMTYIGIGTGHERISFDADDFHFRKLQLRASFASPGIYLPAVLRLLKAGVIPGEKLISHVFPLADIAQAMLTCRDHKDEALKVLAKP